mmetsp:Transcript_9082/g.16481  ORF Transcript_9082/g.16481 Transcript_9082/m.16481 type:complete len:426 (-) Transcript_9082:156-1433(-)
MEETSSNNDDNMFDIRRMSKVLKSCRDAGKNENFEEVQQLASLGLQTVEEAMVAERGWLRSSKREFLLASFQGYKGYTLWKQKQYHAALPCLRESQRLRKQLQQRHASEQCLEKRQQILLRKEGYTIEHALNECLEEVNHFEEMKKPIKYPRTVHLFDSGGTAMTSDDLVLEDLSSVMNVLSSRGTKLIVEEKIDGANLGISQCAISGKILVQNRSHFICKGDHAQFHRIPEWVAEHQEALLSILQGGNRILYGEWMVARHSIPYQRLPGWFVAFDLYDKEMGRFLSRRRFHSALKGSSIPVVPTIHKDWRRFTEPEIAVGVVGESNHGYVASSSAMAEKLLRKKLVDLLESKSQFRNDGGTVEGVVLRVDNSTSMWLDTKYKVVRPDFVRGCDGGHWSTRPIEKQRVDFEFSNSYLDSCYVFAD